METRTPSRYCTARTSPTSFTNQYESLTSSNTIFGKGQTATILACDHDVTVPRLNKSVRARHLTTSHQLCCSRHLNSTRLHGGITSTTRIVLQRILYPSVRLHIHIIKKHLIICISRRTHHYIQNGGLFNNIHVILLTSGHRIN